MLSSLTSGVDGSQFRLKLKKLKLENEIPSPVATQSYRYPNVEKIKKSRFRFRSLPDVDGLREFGKITKFFWEKQEIRFGKTKKSLSEKLRNSF